MAMRNILSKMIMPQLDRHLSAELQQASAMVDNMLAPTAHAYVLRKSSGGSSTFGGTKVLMEKVTFPTVQRGLFADAAAAPRAL